MKKFKLFALAVFAMLSTNAFAVDIKTHSNGTFTYTYDADLATPVATITGFVSELPAAQQVTVNIPTSVKKQDNTTSIDVTKIGANAFKDNENITAVTIPDTKVVEIEGGAFEGCTGLTEVTIGKKVATIGKSFNGCTSLATVTFNAPAEGEYQTIAAGAFEETAIVTLDLTTSGVQVLNQLFENLNTTLTTVKLPATLTTISDAAFKQLAALTTIDWTACKTPITIGNGTAGVFDGAPQIKELVLPAQVIAISKNALAGSNIQKLTITSSATAGAPTIKETGATKLTELIVKGNFVGVIGDDDAAKEAFTSLTKVTFEGTVKAGAITGGAFSGCLKLAEVNFQGNLEAAAVKAAAFGSATAGNYAGKSLTGDADGIKLTVNYSPSTDAAAALKAFDLAAFSSDGSQGNYAKLVTTTAYKTFLVTAGGGGWTDTAANDYMSLIVDAPEALAETANLKMESNGSGKYYYAKLYTAAGTTYKIAAKQGENKDVTVVAYGAYADSDGTIYMENLKIIDGFYWIPATTPVIVKSTSDADVVLTASDNSKNSTMKDFGGAASSQIAVKANDMTGLAVKDATTAGYATYFLAPIKDYGFRWSKFKDERVIKGATSAFNKTTKATEADFLIECKVPATADRIKIVWLDGSEEEATAIQTVKSAKAENGAIFNLAGQKVNASYKGVVIKDGKKYIQK